MKNKLQQKANELHFFVSGKITPLTRQGNYNEQVKALGIRLLQLAYDERSDEFKAHVDDAYSHAFVTLLYERELTPAEVTHSRNLFKGASKSFESQKLEKEANFCRMCNELFRVFDKTDFSQASGCPRACVKAWYAGADYEAIQHAVMLVF